MGFAQRDYARRPTRGGNGLGFDRWTVNTWLIAINVAVFVAEAVFSTPGALREPWVVRWGAFTVLEGVYRLQLWRFITFQFLHMNLQHIVFNMISLYMFGPMVEEYLSSRRYVIFYLLCGMAGAATFFLLVRLHMLHNPGGSGIELISPLIGASAGIFGVLIAAATRVAPDAMVLVGFMIPMRLRTLAWILLGLAIYTVINSGNNAGGQAAHLGGAALGYFLIQRPELLNGLTRWPTIRRRPRPRMRMEDRR